MRRTIHPSSSSSSSSSSSIVLVLGLGLVLGLVGLVGLLVVVAVVVVGGGPAGRTAQKYTALLGHETKTTLIWNYCLGSTDIYGRCFLAVGDILWAYFIKN